MTPSSDPDAAITARAKEVASALVDDIPGFLGITPDPWPWNAEDVDGSHPFRVRFRDELVRDIAKGITAALCAVRDETREECAKVADAFAREWFRSPASMESEAAAAEEIAASIRAGGGGVG